MLDQFVVGRVSRISPEAPVPVVEHDHDEYRIGGAGNVAHNVARPRRRASNWWASSARDAAADRLRGELRGDRHRRATASSSTRRGRPRRSSAS